MTDAPTLRAEADRLIRLMRWAWDEDVRQKLKELGHALECEALELEQREPKKRNFTPSPRAMRRQRQKA